MIKPFVDYIYNDYGISCDRYNNKEKYSEMLGLRFENVLGDICNVFILNVYGKLEMKIDKDNYESFDIKKLAVKILDKLN